MYTLAIMFALTGRFQVPTHIEATSLIKSLETLNVNEVWDSVNVRHCALAADQKKYIDYGIQKIYRLRQSRKKIALFT